MSYSPNFKRIPYTAEERAAIARQERIEREYNEEMDAPVLTWTASNGEKIVVKLARDGGHRFDVWVGDGYCNENCKISEVPANQAAAAKAAGIVAKLGPVGLTIERKTVLDTAW